MKNEKEEKIEMEEYEISNGTETLDTKSEKSENGDKLGNIHDLVKNGNFQRQNAYFYLQMALEHSELLRSDSETVETHRCLQSQFLHQRILEK